MEGGYNYDAGSDVEEFMEGDNYDVEAKVIEGFFPEEFRKYVRDHNLFCCYLFRRHNSCWFFINKHESDADRDITTKLANLVDTYIYVQEQCLIQFWRAQEVIGDFGERRFRLTSRNQPFIFMRRKDYKTPFSEGICSYRMKMADFITGDRGGGGVIGRVFRNNRAECTPNIGYYSYEEYSHQDLPLSCQIKSSLAFPLSDSSGHSIGVVNIVSSVESNLLTWNCFRYMLEFCNCSEGIHEQYDSLEMAVSEIEEVMQLVGRSCCLVCAETWMLCNRCSYLSTCERLDDILGGFYKQEYFEYDVWSDLCPLKKGEGVVGKAATSPHNLVYCDDVSQFSITEYPLAHFARYNKLTACFATCLRSNRTGNQIYVLEFFLNPSKVSGRGPRAMLVSILEGMRKKFRTFKLASGEEIGDNLSVHVIDARFPDKFEILEIGKLDSVENYTFEMDLIHNNSFEISTDNRGGELAVNGLAIDNGENMGSNIGEQPVAISSWENQHNNATISSIGVINSNISQQPAHIDGLAIDNDENMGSNTDEQPVAIASLENQHNNATNSSDERGGKLAIGVINSDISLQPLVEANAVHTEESIAGSSEECNINSSKLPPRRGWNAIDISLEELKEVSDMKRKDAAKMLKVSLSTFKRVCKYYQISRWPPRKKNLDQSRSGNSALIGSMKEFGGSVPAAQNESLVTIKAKYGDNFIKFKLSASSGINAFNQQVSKRLELEAGSYVVKYKDDDNDWILVRCDDDLQDYISSSASLGKTTLTMLLEHI